MLYLKEFTFYDIVSDLYIFKTEVGRGWIQEKHTFSDVSTLGNCTFLNNKILNNQGYFYVGVYFK